MKKSTIKAPKAATRQESPFPQIVAGKGRYTDAQIRKAVRSYFATRAA